MSYVVGYVIIFGIVLLPFYVMIAAWFTGKPREPEKALMGVGYILAVWVLLLVGVWVMGAVLGLIVPG